MDTNWYVKTKHIIIYLNKQIDQRNLNRLNTFVHVGASGRLGLRMPEQLQTLNTQGKWMKTERRLTSSTQNLCQILTKVFFLNREKSVWGPQQTVVTYKGVQQPHREWPKKAASYLRKVECILATTTKGMKTLEWSLSKFKCQILKWRIHRSHLFSPDITSGTLSQRTCCQSFKTCNCDQFSSCNKTRSFTVAAHPYFNYKC